MSATKTVCCLFVIALVCFTVVGCGRGNKKGNGTQTSAGTNTAAQNQDEEKKKQAIKEIEKAFADIVEKDRKGDVRGFCEAMTKETQARWAAISALAYFQVKESKKPEDADLEKQLEATLKKHNITEQTLKEIDKEALKDPKKSEVLLEKIAEPVKNKVDFIEEIAKTIRQRFDFFPKDAKLTNIEVNGGRATAIAVGTTGGMERKLELEFRKVDGNWKIEIPLTTIFADVGGS